MHAGEDAPMTITNTDALPVNIWQDESGYYWQRADGRDDPCDGPHRTRDAAKHHAGSILYIEAGKAGIRWIE